MISFHVNVGAIALLASLAITFGSWESNIASQSLLFETFGQGWEDRWVHSQDDKYTGRFVIDNPAGWPHHALKVSEKNHHYGITALLPQPLDVAAAGVTMQYAVKFAEGMNCGGAYVKLVTHSEGFQPVHLKDDTPYSIMFGPDKCGSAGKVHLIVRHQDPVQGTVVEHHLKDAPIPTADGDTHIYTLQIRTDSTFEMWEDGTSISKGSLLDKLDPPLVPPATIADPDDVMPADWVNEDEMPDPTAVKPVNWDDREYVPDEEAVQPDGWLEHESPLVEDTDAVRPAEWDEQRDGAWAASQVLNPRCSAAPGCGPWQRPSVRNPDYQGRWYPPLVPNPEYKGPWERRQIRNPDYDVFREPLKGVSLIGGLAVEIWTTDAGYTFGGFLVTTNDGVARQYRVKALKAVRAAEKAALKAAKREQQQQEQGAAGSGNEEVTPLADVLDDGDDDDDALRSPTLVNAIARGLIRFLDKPFPIKAVRNLRDWWVGALRAQPGATLVQAVLHFLGFSLMMTMMTVGWQAREKRGTQHVDLREDRQPPAAVPPSSGAPGDAAAGEPGAEADEPADGAAGGLPAGALQAAPSEQPAQNSLRDS